MVTISKFFAELGFKVNSSEFKQVESTLKQINNAYKQLSQEVKLQGLELKNKLTQQKINTETEKTATQASKAQKAAIDTETAAIRKQTAELNLQNKQNRTRLGLLSKLMPYISAYAIGAGIRATAQEGLRYRDFQRQTGLDVGGLQQYEKASQMLGSTLTSEQVTSDIQKLQQSIEAIHFAKGDVTPFQVLGITPERGNAYEVIEGLRERIKGLDDTSALYWVRQIGLSDDWLHILRQSREEFDSIQAAMLSKDQIRSVSALGLAFRRVQFALRQFRDQLVAFTSGVLTTALSNFSQMTTELSAFIKSMSESKDAFAVFAAGISMIMLAIAPLTTMLVGLLLLLEDMWVASKGGESFFDWDVDAFEKFKDTIIEGIKEIISMAKTAVKWVNRLTGNNEDEEEKPKEKKKSFSILGYKLWEYTPKDSVEDLIKPENLTKGITPNAQNITVNAPRNVNATVNVNNTEEAVDYTRHLEEMNYHQREIDRIDKEIAALEGRY